MIPAISNSLSALLAFGKKMSVISNNVANCESEGFKKKRAIISEGPVQGVTVEINQINSPGPQLLEEQNGKIIQKDMSNVDLAEEIPQSLLTKRHHSANIKSFRTADETLGSVLDIIE